jgi:glucosamine-6-phosphate isomerase
MQLNIYKDYNELSVHAANAIIELVKNKPHAVLCLAAGDTPRLTYSLMAKKAQEEKIDFSKCSFIGLDEWVGIPPQNEGSCRYFLQTTIFTPLQIASEQINLFDALSNDLEKECTTMNKKIIDKGGIDLMLVGVGMNGHIGFNEPGVPVSNNAHVIDLDEVTQSVGQKYFSEPVAIKKGITLGLNQLLQSRKAIMMANGLKKAPVISKTLEEEINIGMPASIIRKHAQGIVMIDKEAASALKI